MELTVRWRRYDPVLMVRGLLAAGLVGCVACGSPVPSSESRQGDVPVEQVVDDVCLGVEARVEQLMTFMSNTDDLELLLRAMREPAASDVGLHPRDASDKYLSLKTWIEIAAAVAPGVFTGTVIWSDMSQADGATKLAHARTRLRAIDVDRLSREVGARREYIGTHLAEVNRCLEAMQSAPGAAAPQ